MPSQMQLIISLHANGASKIIEIIFKIDSVFRCLLQHGDVELLLGAKLKLITFIRLKPFPRKMRHLRPCLIIGLLQRPKTLRLGL